MPWTSGCMHRFVHSVRSAASQFHWGTGSHWGKVLSMGDGGTVVPEGPLLKSLKSARSGGPATGPLEEEHSNRCLFHKAQTNGDRTVQTS